MNERQLAFKILNKIERDNAYSNLTLDAALRENAAASASSAFVTALVYGVTERKITLDFILSRYLTKPLKKLRPEVLTVLRLGAFQLCFMDKVPASAAVNESVKLVKGCGCAYASGLVNSVLRKIAKDGFTYEKTGEKIKDLSIIYSCPKTLVSKFIEDYGEEKTEKILSSSIGARPVTARVNTLKASPDELITLLSGENAVAEKCPENENYIILKNTGAVEELKAYKAGFFHVQDISCGKAVKALSPKAGDTVFDMCSSPGGKAFTAAQLMKNKGKILAFDLYPQRVKLCEEGALRLGIDIIEAKVGDACVFLPEYEKAADKVLCDVPCSGFGIIGRKPEIRYKDIAIIDNLLPVQYNILANAAKYVKSGGTLVYSTCTLSRAENEGVCEKFLGNNAEFRKISFNTIIPTENGGDGFFFAVFGRI